MGAIKKGVGSPEKLSPKYVNRSKHKTKHSASATAVNAIIFPNRNSCAEMLETYTCRIVFCSPSFAMARAASRGGNMEITNTNTPRPEKFFQERTRVFQKRTAGRPGPPCPSAAGLS